MNINETELREDLGTFGGAVKNGWLKPNFQVEEVIMDVHDGKPCLKCHMSRWFGRDDDIILLPDGTGINVDPKAKNDKTFKWKSIRALHTSFAKAILIGTGIGAAAGAGVGALGGHLGWWGGATAKGAAEAGAANATIATAGKTAAKQTAKETGKNAVKKTASQKAKKAAGYSLVGGDIPSYSYNSSNGGNVLTEEQINEIAHALVGGAIGAAGGAILGGIYALIKNRDDVMYYSDGSYVSRKGTVEGRWDGSVEREAKGKVGGGVTTSVQVPGMPADFGKNPENVKIAQRYLVANHANISTTKSVDGIDGKLGPRTRRAIVAYMTQHNCDFAKFWADAQEYSTTAQHVEDLKKQNMEMQAQLQQNKHITVPEMEYQKPQQQVQAVNEIKEKFYDIFNRMNNATILQ